jgi:predicted nuclease of restriction endonuclease-like (RecB) superfamily
MIELTLYADLLKDIKSRIQQAQVKATLSANAEMIQMYWDIGRMIHARQQKEGWGAGVIPRLAKDIRNDIPEVKGFSERNIGYMVRFAREYKSFPILQQAAAKLGSGSKVPQPVAQFDKESYLSDL